MWDEYEKAGRLKRIRFRCGHGLVMWAIPGGWSWLPFGKPLDETPNSSDECIDCQMGRAAQNTGSERPKKKPKRKKKVDEDI